MPGLPLATERAAKQPTIPDTALLVEQALSPQKGRGMIATQNIKRGARIISEEPLLVLEESNDKSLLGEFRRLSASKHEQFADLSDKAGSISPSFLVRMAEELEKCHQYSGRYLKAAVRDYAKMHAIFYGNAVIMGPHARHGIGVFPTYSYLNHSCTPNVQHSYNSTIGRVVVHAVRDIAQGEEILTSYVSLQQTTRLRKVELFKKWGFDCQCDTCHKSNDSRRQRLFEIDQGFVLMEEETDEKILESAVAYGVIPKTERVALKWAEESVELLKAEDLVGMDLAKAYRTCSKYSLREGQLDKALQYARKELELQVTCLGKDTAYLSSDEDANAWIKHIEDMSKADKVRMRMNEKRVQKEQKKMEKKAAKKAGNR